MAVRIPDLNRNSPQADQSVGRVQTEIPDISGALNMQTEAVGKLAGSAGAYFQAEKMFAADTTATNIANQYHKYKVERLSGEGGAKYAEGDPGIAYEKYHADAKKVYDGLLSSNPDMDEYTRSVVKKKLDTVDFKTHDEISTAQGAQIDKWQNKVTDDTVELSKNSMMTAAAKIDPKDPKSTQMLDLAIDEILTARTNLALKKHSGIRGEDGKYTYDNSVIMKTKKDVAEGLYKTIDNLIGTGEVEKAKYVRDNYKGYLDVLGHASVEDKLQKAVVKQEAMILFDGAMRLPPEKAAAKINASAKPEVREQALALLDSHNRRMDNQVKSSSKQNYNLAATYIANNNFQDVTSMKNDPYLSLILPRVTDGNQLKALMHQVTAPNVSDENVKGNLYEILRDGKDGDPDYFKKMSYPELLSNMGGLSKSDRTMFENQWKKFNVESKSDEASSTRYMATQLTKAMLNAKLVKHNSRGRFDDKNQVKINKAYDSMIADMEKMPANASLADKNKWIGDYVTQHIKDGGVIPELPQTRKFDGGTKTQTLTKAPSADSTVVDLTDREKLVKAQNEFKSKVGRWPNLKTQELQLYMKSGTLPPKEL